MTRRIHAKRETDDAASALSDREMFNREITSMAPDPEDSRVTVLTMACGHTVIICLPQDVVPKSKTYYCAQCMRDALAKAKA